MHFMMNHVQTPNKQTEMVSRLRENRLDTSENYRQSEMEAMFQMKGREGNKQHVSKAYTESLSTLSPSLISTRSL